MRFAPSALFYGCLCVLPGRDFTRNVKLPFAKLITLILSLKGSSITCEFMEHFGCTKTLVSESAFVKRRGRLLPEALETIFRLFVENTRPSNRYKGFRLLAVDGSDLHTPTNPHDTASFISGSAGQGQCRVPCHNHRWQRV